MNWRSYWKWFLGTLMGLLLFLAAVLWTVDPYGNLPGSPPFDRTAMASNQRYSYPAVARDLRYDSAVFGTSTTRMLEPTALDAAFGGRFANLSMNSATAYEQARLFGVFRQAHAAPKAIIFGLDGVWCTIEQEQTRYTFRTFPEWMYDDNPWNDIPAMLDFKSFEDAGRQAAYLLGMKAAKYGPDGYANFLPPASEYDLVKVRWTLYGAAGPGPRRVVADPVEISADDRARWRFPSHDYLRRMLESLPTATRKLLVFVPVHINAQPVPGTRSDIEWKECKDRIGKIVSGVENAALLDFMISSPLTTRDRNYWDLQHYTAAVAARLVRLIARGVRNEMAPDGEYVIRDRM